MSDEVVFETMAEVHSAYIDWESEGKAVLFGLALAKTAEKCLRAKFKVNYNEYDKEVLEKDLFFFLSHMEDSFRLCLTDNLRKLVIRYHARGYTTTNAIQLILKDDALINVTPFCALAGFGCGYNNVKSFLVGRMSYLKLSHPRFPHKKFGAYWESERADYVDRIKNIPLSQPNEQLEQLSEHYFTLKDEYELARSIQDKERIHKCMMQTMSAIHVITRNVSIPEAPRREATPEKQSSALEAPKTASIDIPGVSERRIAILKQTDA